ncbi:hypothetical protein ACFLUG_00920 [Chloroflexota bacterium]
MKKKILLGVMLGLTLLFTSCYPELSVQQYDKLKEDLVALDVRRAQLEVEVEGLNLRIEELETTHAAESTTVRTYINFLEKMVSTQSSEMILTGEFDVGSLVNSKEILVTMADELDDQQINYFIGLMDSENKSQTVAAYYKTVEYCIKEIKLTLQ